MIDAWEMIWFSVIDDDYDLGLQDMTRPNPNMRFIIIESNK